MKCENCKKYEATRKDYRYDDYGGVNKVLSCKWCVQLTDMWHYRVRAERFDPKKLVEDD